MVESGQNCMEGVALVMAHFMVYWPQDWVDELKKAGYWVYALEADGEEIYKTAFADKTALVIGGEDSGVKRLTREKCDACVSIPLRGKVNSLNASVALGIAVYEVIKR